MRIVVLGCGFHGRGIAYQLAAAPDIRLHVLDRNKERAQAVGKKAAVSWGIIDVTDRQRLRDALTGAHLVVNAVGPYHLTGLGVIEAAIDAGVHYVDMNDDHEVAEAVLGDPSWDERAGRAGVTVLIDCGVVPGLSGLLVRHGAEQLDRTERVVIRFVWNYSREYPAAIQHFLRINSGEGPQYVDGRPVRMRPFDGREEVEFQHPVGKAVVYYTGVPDTVAIARFIPGVQQAEAKGAFYQEEANRLVEDLVRWGFTSYEPPAPGMPSPMEYLMTYLGSPQGVAFFDIPQRDLPLAVRVEVSGSREGRPMTLHFEAHDHTRRATTTFTALAALAVARGELAPGVQAPEAWPHAASFLRDLLADRHIRILEWRDEEPARQLAITDGSRA
jgi:saccharopine dehydrogenase-like NADP-dependent oxidoreductase